MASSSSSQTVPHKYAISTRLVHADDNSESAITDIAPPLHVSTTYSVTGGPASFTYSRSDHPTRRRVETVLETLCGGPTFCFASGVAAVTAVLYAARPKRLFTMLGYFGSRGAVTSYRAIGRNELADTMFEHVEQLLEQELESGDLVMIESPRNPDALLVDIELVAAHVRRFASVHPPPLLAIDNTFATPYIVQPLLLGANFEINSCSKCMTQPRRRHRRCWCWHTFSLSYTRACGRRRRSRRPLGRHHGHRVGATREPRSGARLERVPHVRRRRTGLARGLAAAALHTHLDTARRPPDSLGLPSRALARAAPGRHVGAVPVHTDRPVARRVAQVLRGRCGTCVLLVQDAVC